MPRPDRLVIRSLAVLAAICGLVMPVASVAVAGGAEIYGAGVDLEAPTRIADILAAPDAFIGKTVRVDGGVIDVCPRKGCWMELGDDEATIRVKVEDGVIVFPAAARGRVAAAQGVVEAIEMSRERYLGWLAHLAEERGEPFDAAAAEIGDGPFRLIRIRGTGARIGAADDGSRE